MHEMSIAMSIIDIATENAKKEKAEKVVEVDLDIGSLAGIEFEALEFALDISKKNTLLEDAKIKIHKIQALAQCLDCKKEFIAQGMFNNCPECKSFDTKLLNGKELQVKSIIID